VGLLLFPQHGVDVIRGQKVDDDLPAREEGAR
jgi:hypothetical protein